MKQTREGETLFNLWFLCANPPRITYGALNAFRLLGGMSNTDFAASLDMPLPSYSRTHKNRPESSPNERIMSKAVRWISELVVSGEALTWVFMYSDPDEQQRRAESCQAISYAALKKILPHTTLSCTELAKASGAALCNFCQKVIRGRDDVNVPPAVALKVHETAARIGRTKTMQDAIKIYWFLSDLMNKADLKQAV